MATNQRFTEKAQEAILQAQRQTDSLKLSQLEPEVILQALVQQSDGIVPQVLLKSGLDSQRIAAEITAEVNRLPKLQFSADATVSQGTRKMLEAAEREARHLGDEYVSTEHLLLGVYDVSGSPAAALLIRHGLTPELAREKLREIRGAQRVT